MNMRKSLALLPCLALFILAAGCERLPDKQVLGGTPLNFAELTDSVPLDYGRFVTAMRLNEHNVMLWFERPDQSLVGVRVSSSRAGDISKNAVIIPRR